MMVSRRAAYACVVTSLVVAACGGAWARQSAPQPSGGQGQSGGTAPAQGAPGTPGTPGAPGERPGGPGAPGGRGGMQVPVSVAMNSIERAYKALTPQIADGAKKDENLRLIAEMQRGIAVSKAQPLPEDVGEKTASEADKAKASAEYRRRLTQAMRLMLDIEDDIDAGRGAEAAKKLSALQDLEHEAHESLGVGEEH